MSIPFRTDIDLRRNQTLQRVIEKLANAPLGPVVGQEYYNTGDNSVYVWNGTIWMNLSLPVGEVNTASNIGVGGVGVYKQKTGLNLEFKNINANSTKVAITNDAVNGEVKIDVVESVLNISNMTGTLGVNHGGTGVTALSGIVKGNGSSAFTAATANSDYLAPVSGAVNLDILTTNGAGVPQDSGKKFNDSGTTSADVWSAAQTTSAINNAFAAQDAMIYKGVIDCSASPNYPVADSGWTYKISAAGKIGGIAGVVVEVGDVIICTTDGSLGGNQAAVGTQWNVIQTNIAGAVTGPASSLDQHLPVFNGTSGTVIASSSAYLTGNNLIATGNVYKNTNQALAGVYRATIGNASAISFTLTHGLGNLAAVVSIYEAATGVQTYGTVTRIDANSVSVAFTAAPGTNELEVVIHA